MSLLNAIRGKRQRKKIFFASKGFELIMSIVVVSVIKMIFQRKEKKSLFFIKRTMLQ